MYMREVSFGSSDYSTVRISLVMDFRVSTVLFLFLVKLSKFLKMICVDNQNLLEIYRMKLFYRALNEIISES